MPYQGERASRLGHVDLVRNPVVAQALSRWRPAGQGEGTDPVAASRIVPVDELDGPVLPVDRTLTVDGSCSELAVSDDHPTVKVGFLRVAATLLDLTRYDAARTGRFVDPAALASAQRQSSFDAALPGVRLVAPGSTGVDTWRDELDGFLATTRVDEAAGTTLEDALFLLYGRDGEPADTLPLDLCPGCGETFPAGREIPVPRDGGACPACGTVVLPADVLRTHLEYDQVGSSTAGLIRVMNVAERLTTVAYLHLLRDDPALDGTLFVTDGPLAMFGPTKVLARHYARFLSDLARHRQARGMYGPLLVGVEKTGAFAEHARAVRERIEPGSVMTLPLEAITALLGRPFHNDYGRNYLYGRRFVHRTGDGTVLTLTVPAVPGVHPYAEDGSGEDLAAYPTLRSVCTALDGLTTSRHEDAIVPVVMAHGAASLPAGVGHSVLRTLAQTTVPGLQVSTGRPGWSEQRFGRR